MLGRLQLWQYVTPANPDWHIDSWNDSGGKETKGYGDHLQHDQIQTCKSVYPVMLRPLQRHAFRLQKGGWLVGHGKGREESGRNSLNFCICYLFICYFNPFILLSIKWVSIKIKITTLINFHATSVALLGHKTLFPLISDSSEKPLYSPPKQ